MASFGLCLWVSRQAAMHFIQTLGRVFLVEIAACFLTPLVFQARVKSSVRLNDTLAGIVL
jgi:hypothetical protein